MPNGEVIPVSDLISHLTQKAVVIQCNLLPWDMATSLFWGVTVLGKSRHIQCTERDVSICTMVAHVIDCKL